MRIAFVGCGYVADFYARTLRNHPNLELAGVTDRDPERAARFAQFHSVPAYPSLGELLKDESIGVITNLTNPASHFSVSMEALGAGKHVYSEKPLALNFAQAQQLVEVAEKSRLYLAGAPCTVLGESAQTLWKALRNNAVGRPRLVYAELDDGLIHRMQFKQWRSASGNPWPFEDEFEVGCTIEHAGYYVTWLVAFFGPARSVTSFASCLVPDKDPAVPPEKVAPDFTAASIQFASGVVARVTNSIIAPRDHSLRIIGDDGVLSIKDCWDYGSAVYLTRRTPLGVRLESRPLVAQMLRQGPRKYPLVRKVRFRDPSERLPWKHTNRLDFARGIAELVDAIAGGRDCRLSARFSLHVNEIVLAMQYPHQMGSPRTIESEFEPPAPMPWAV